MATPGKVVLFLDAENHDRSRVAEVLFNTVARRMGLGWRAGSRGLAPRVPTKKEGPMAAASAKALQLRGVRDDALTRTPLVATDGDLDAASLVIVVDRAVQAAVAERFPAAAGRIEVWEAAPSGDATAAVEREVSNLVARLLGGNASPAPPPPPADAAVRPATATTVKVGRETKGRKGKGVTVVSDLPLDDRALQELATLLKTRCGTGGTAKEGRIEIQGDQRDRIAAELERLGYRVKRAGG